MHFRTDSERFRDMSGELARRVQVVVGQSSHWREKVGVPGVIIFGQSIPVSYILDHYDVSVGML